MLQLHITASDRSGGLSVRLALVCALLLALAACSDQSPVCPFTGTVDQAPSAGCFAVSQGGLLLVQGLDGKISLPGGSGKSGESAQCTAFRETWEETGLRLQPRELLRVFDTGFHLYRCEQGALLQEIQPRQRFEVRAAFYLPADQFEQYQWRYAYQEVLLGKILSQGSAMTSN